MIEFKLENATMTCIPSKEIVATNVPTMRDLLISRLDEDQTWDSLVLDCSLIETLDSIGVNLIVGLFKKVKANDKQFKVIGCNQPILKVLELFRLNTQFSVEAR